MLCMCVCEWSVSMCECVSVSVWVKCECWGVSEWWVCECVKEWSECVSVCGWCVSEKWVCECVKEWSVCVSVWMVCVSVKEWSVCGWCVSEWRVVVVCVSEEWWVCGNEEWWVCEWLIVDIIRRLIYLPNHSARWWHLHLYNTGHRPVLVLGTHSQLSPTLFKSKLNAFSSQFPFLSTE